MIIRANTGAFKGLQVSGAANVAGDSPRCGLVRTSFYELHDAQEIVDWRCDVPLGMRNSCSAAYCSFGHTARARTFTCRLGGNVLLLK